MDNYLFDHFNLTSGMFVSWDMDRINHSIVDFGYQTNSLSTVRALRQCSAIFSKNASYGSDSEKEDKAFKAFCESENNCKIVNDSYRIQAFDNSVERESILFLAREKIARILGDCPSLQSLRCGFGPGANTTVKNKTSILCKLEAKPVCSKDAFVGHPDFNIGTLMDTYPQLFLRHNCRVRYGQGQLSFVPKDSRKHRSIIIEPLLNTFVQKGIGLVIREKLLAFGVNLKDQRINRNRARLSSMDGSLATVDLSSASDNIAYAVVLDLLPIRWFELLSTWRTSSVYYKKRNITNIVLQKFSTMGNGFTFELQSLIFYALAYACCVYYKVTPDVSVYGDDIILPSTLFYQFSGILSSLGFTVNSEKSFFEGNFRESCGGDFVNGINVRPFYVKDRWSDGRLIAFLNFYHNDPLLSAEARDYLVSQLKDRHKVYGPPGYGDGYIHDDLFVGNPHRRSDGWSGFTFRAFIKKPIRRKSKSAFLDLYAVYGLPFSDEETRILERTYRFTRSFAYEYSTRDDREPSSVGRDPYVVRGDFITNCINIYYIPASAGSSAPSN